MSIVDIAIVSFSSAIGLFRGFFREVLSLVSWLAALWSAYSFARLAAYYLEDYIAHPPLRVVLAFTLIFVAVLCLFSLLGQLVKYLPSKGFKSLDRAFGMVFGVARGAVVVALLMLAVIFMDGTDASWWQRALLLDYFTPIADTLRSFLPSDFENYLEPSEEGIEEFDAFEEFDVDDSLETLQGVVE